MENAVTLVRNEVAGMDARMTGTIAVATPEGIGRYWLMPVLAEFEQRYPEISLQVFTEVRTPGSSLNDVDVTICMDRPALPRLIALHVGQARYNLFASRNYIRRHGFPNSVEELRSHKLVDLFLYRTVPHLAWWNDLVGATRSLALLADSSSLFLAAIQEGVGIGMLPSFCKFAVPELTALPLEPLCHTELWLVRHEATRGSAKISVFNDFLKAQFMRDRARWFS
jgi:DNA-binding transcriptional LysR family regulator